MNNSGLNPMDKRSKAYREAKLKSMALEHAPTVIDYSKPKASGRSNKTQTNCTPKQEAFAKHVAEGNTLADAYRFAYKPTTTNNDTIRRSAVMMSRKPNIIAMVNYYREREEKITPHDPESIRRMLIEKLMETINNPNERTSDRNKAIELLGKVGPVGLFTDQDKTKAEQQSTKLALEQLKARLNLIQDSKPMIEPHMASKGIDESNKSEPSPNPENPRLN